MTPQAHKANQSLLWKREAFHYIGVDIHDFFYSFYVHTTKKMKIVNSIYEYVLFQIIHR